MRKTWYRGPQTTAPLLVNHYAKRWTIKPAFRDTKDLPLGRRLSLTPIGEPTRHDRLLLVSAFAMALLTLLAPSAKASAWTGGEGGAESCGMRGWGLWRSGQAEAVVTAARSAALTRAVRIPMIAAISSDRNQPPVSIQASR